MYQDVVDLNEILEIDDEIVEKSLENDLDLREYSAQIQLQLKKAQENAVKDCIAQVDNLADLHEKINNCDEVLEVFLNQRKSFYANFQDLEKTLSGYLVDLGLISVDMKRLKEQSVVINQQLHNRQKVRGELSQFVDDMVVPHNMIKYFL